MCVVVVYSWIEMKSLLPNCSIPITTLHLDTFCSESTVHDLSYLGLDIAWDVSGKKRQIQIPF